MTSIDTATSRSLSQLESVLDQLRTNLHELGLTVSAWDAAGEAVGQWQAECGFCRTIGACWDGCPKAAKELADRVLTEGNLAKTNSACGCCVIGVPIYQRRRLIGAAVACYPTSEMLEEESLSRLCDRLHLDREIVQRRGRTACRHSAEEADDFLRVLNWMLKREQSIQVSREELTNLSTNLAATYEELSLLYRVSGTMGVTQKPEEFLQNVCCELLEVMNI
ncbi:MAG: hypothetical protein SVT52_05680, partial [Planctomycetota bacterium]|nr:hypothetical protein [Planctomycetota bacterium]